MVLIFPTHISLVKGRGDHFFLFLHLTTAGTAFWPFVQINSHLVSEQELIISRGKRYFCLMSPHLVIVEGAFTG